MVLIWPSKSIFWALSWDSNSWILELRVLILISYYWVFPVTFTLVVGALLKIPSSALIVDNCFDKLSIILSLSATIVALGISFCHLTYRSLKSEFYFYRALNALWSLINPSSDPWISPKTNTFSSALKVRGSIAKTPLNYPIFAKIFDISFLPEVPWELRITPHYLYTFSNLEVRRVCDCLRIL